jgi:hypothetical protein
MMLSKAGVGSPRQFKASIGPRGRRKQRRKPKAGTKEDEEPIASLSRSPAAKVVAPYSPGSEIEDSYLRFLVYHCVPPRFRVSSPA